MSYADSLPPDQRAKFKAAVASAARHVAEDLARQDARRDVATAAECAEQVADWPLLPPETVRHIESLLREPEGR